MRQREGRVTDPREEEYRGYAICVELDERRPNCWGWSYLIDGRLLSISRIALCPGIEEALKEGMADAQSKVDDLEARAVDIRSHTTGRLSISK